MITEGDRGRQIRTKDLTWREIDGQVVVLDLKSNTYLTVNASGVLLWHRLTAGASLHELATVLESRYQLRAPQALTDAKAFIQLLDEHGLLS